MLAIGKNAAPPLLPETAGGFAWWYVDIVGGPDEAVVLLWSRRLPFVPASQHEAAPGPVTVAVAVYRGGREHFYALQCSDASSARELSQRELRIGKSRFEFDHRAGAVRLRADLDLSLPASGRLRGLVEIEGVEARMHAGAPGLLDWTPVTAVARGRAALDWEDEAFELQGRAYFDGNAAPRALDRLEIEDWRWGRIALPSRDLVYFQLTPKGGSGPSPVLLSVDRDGGVESIPSVAASFVDGPSGWFGLRGAERLMLTSAAGNVEVRFAHQVEDGFFYQRYLVTARTDDGEVGHGVAERVVPPRLSAAWHRPLVRMRVDHTGERPSMWLPLFSGPRQGRFTRLLKSWSAPAREVAP